LLRVLSNPGLRLLRKKLFNNNFNNFNNFNRPRSNYMNQKKV
jgi:hypothetical protein